MLLEQFAGERPLGAFLAQHVVLRRRQKLVPLRVGVGDFVIGGCLRGWRARQAANEERGEASATSVQGLSACDHVSSLRSRVRRFLSVATMWRCCTALA